MADPKTADAIEEPRAETADELRVKRDAMLDKLVATKKARSRRHAQFLVNAGALSA